jgi:hypothetical protein
MVKLTLSVDERVVERAKQYAAERGTSVSRIVETMLTLVSQPEAPSGAGASAPAAPVLARVRGLMKRGGVEHYRQYLRRKYR